MIYFYDPNIAIKKVWYLNNTKLVDFISLNLKNIKDYLNVIDKLIKLVFFIYYLNIINSILIFFLI